MNEILDRLKQFIENEHTSIRSFALHANINAGTLSQQIKGTRALSLETIICVLSTYPSLSAEWLLRGIGEMSGNTSSPNSGDEYYTRLISIKQQYIDFLEVELAKVKMM